MGVPYSQGGFGQWPADACAYCHFRPRAPAGTAESDLWWYGTGDGAHNPHRCKAFKRYLAEGGDRSADPQFVDHLSACLKLDNSYGRGKGK